MNTEEVWTIGRLMEWTKKFLAQKGCEFPSLDAEVLLAHALGCKRIDLFARFNDEVAEGPRAKYRELIKQRVEGCPVAYLVGRKEFFSLTFEVNRDVLIPRPDTEWLVIECLRLAKEVPGPRILDLGTGSGNVPVALAHRLKTAQVTTVDSSPKALAVAQRNAEKHGVTDRVRFLEGDLFAPLDAGEQFDFVVSNPPYIPTGDIPNLEPGVCNYEPHPALDGGPDGFAVFDRIVADAPRFLKPGGYLLVEIGSPQEAGARQRIGAHPGYELFPTVLDGSRHPRVVYARWTRQLPGD